MYSVTDSGILKTVETWCVVIPLHDNDGQPFDKSLIDGILHEILLNYPGFSVTNTVGYWKGAERTHADENYQILIDAVPDSTFESSKFFAALKQELQSRLRQEKIYITKQDSKQELLSFDEFFDEVGVQTPSSNLKQEANNIAKRLVSNIDFVLQRLGYETTALRRLTNQRKIVWERTLCGIRLSSELNDSLPEGVKIIAADQITELGEALAGQEPFAIIGSYEFQFFILEKSNYHVLVESNNQIPNHDKFYCFSPLGEPLSVKRFIEEFAMSSFTNWLVLRDEGFLKEDIKLGVGENESWQLGLNENGNILLKCPAHIPEKNIQIEVIECLIAALKLYESNSADPVAILQAKAKNNYILKRAIVRHTIKNLRAR